MSILSKNEKNELLEMSRSKDFKNDMRKLSENKKKYIRKSSDYLDNYIKVLNLTNAFTNHTQKKLKKIKGKNFKL